MRRSIFRLIAVFVLCASFFCISIFAVEGEVQSETCRITLVQISYVSRTKETIATIPLQEAFSYRLTVPGGCVLPSTILVKMDDRTVSNTNEQVYSYDEITGEILFHQGSITGDVTITVNYPSGLLYVGNRIVYQNYTKNTSFTKGITFNPTTNTLTLENHTIENCYVSGDRYVYGIYSNLEPLNIVLKGENSIVLPENTSLNAYGIYAKGAICISGSSKDTADTLSITTGSVTRSYDGATNCGIYSSIPNSSLVFEDVTINIQTGSALSEERFANNYGICVNSPKADYGGITFRNCTLSVKGGNSTAEWNAYSAGIYVDGYDNDMICIDNSTLSVSAGTAFSQRNATSNGMDLCGDVQISNSAVTILSSNADCAEGTAISNGLYSLLSITTNDSKLHATSLMPDKGEEIDSIGCGVFANNLTLKDSELQSQGGNSALFLMKSLELDYGTGQEYHWTVFEHGPYTPGQAAGYKNKRTYTFLHILPDTAVDIPDIPSTNIPTDTPTDTSVFFADVHGANHWATPAIDQAVANGWMLGTDDTHFSPNAQTTRGMVVTTLWRLEQQPHAADGPSFPDIVDAWYSDAVRWAAGKALVNGYSDGTFGPNDAITREQLVTILWRYAKENGIAAPAGAADSMLAYTDANAISQFAAPAFQWACDAEIITGKPDNLLDPQGTATRAEFAHMLMKYVALTEAQKSN